MTIRKTLFILALIVTSLVACSQKSDDTSTDVATSVEETALKPADGIDWFEGSVDEAFAAAKAENKPIYLYWGAVWCPPCHAISATVFKSPEFIERSQLFIPVYLDGDTEDAQSRGEQFGVRGYPTMIVFDSEGTELTRIPGGIDLQAYANILDLTLSNASSASGLVANILGESPQLTDAECTQLAYYSWGQDMTILADHDEADAFRRMYQACPETLGTARSILYLNWLESSLAAEEAVLSAAQRAEALEMVKAIVTDDEFAKANIFSMLFSAADFTRELTAANSDDRAALVSSFYKLYDRLAGDESVYKRERIYTLAGKIDLERIDDSEAEISDELKAEIREMAKWADESTPSVYERQPIINAMGNILDEAGMDETAKPMLLAELEISKQPYYFMVSLADIEQRAGNTEAAIEWLKKAYDASKGPATRFQWGYYYLAGLLEMAPEDTDLIQQTTVGLIAELQKGGGFYQRPKAQLARLEQRLIDWSEANESDVALDDIRQSVMAVCATDERDQSRETCQSFLDAA